MRRFGSELIFVSRIKRDGSGTEKVDAKSLQTFDKESYKINSLSITEGTFIASGMSSFVVKLKNPPPKDKF